MERKSRLIDVVIPGGARQAILSATLLRPEKQWYGADLARHLGLSRSSLQRDLTALIDVGILKSHREGRMVYFQADPQCPVLPELQGLLAKTAGLVDVLRDALVPFGDRIAFGFIYGSVAHGGEVSASDVDLLVVGTAGLADLAGPLGRAQEKLGRDVNPKLYRPAEFAKRVADQDHFLLSVLGKPKLFVIGAEHDLDPTAE